jgi:signal peptidase II
MPPPEAVAQMPLTDSRNPAAARRWRALGFALVLAASIGCDQAAKHVARETLSGSAGVALASGLVRFELAANPGAFLSLGAGLPESVRKLAFVAGVPVLLAALLALALRAGLSSPRQLGGLALLAGGGLGNWLDRMLHGGAVVDFVSLGIGALRTGIFNLADVWILAGVALLVLGGGRRDAAEPRVA